jgi:hypothetical protein
MMEKRYVRTETCALGQTYVQITDRETGDTFPEAEENRHYVTYKAWLDAGNTPDLIETLAVCEVK